jgi:hypothetical protein
MRAGAPGNLISAGDPAKRPHFTVAGSRQRDIVKFPSVAEGYQKAARSGNSWTMRIGKLCQVVCVPMRAATPFVTVSFWHKTGAWSL